MADKDTPLGMEFMRWQNAPSLSEAIMGGKNPLLKSIGILLGGSGGEQSQAAVPPAMGQGVSPSSGVGIAPQKSSGLGISNNQFKIPALTLPQIGQVGTDVDGDGQVDTFWGLNK